MKFCLDKLEQQDFSKSINGSTQITATLTLEEIVGATYVAYGDPDKLEPYSHDETPDPKYAHMPKAVVRPGSAEEIAAILKLANRELIPVILYLLSKC